MKKGRKSSPNATPVYAYIILNSWIIENKTYPYPTKEQKLRLSRDTNLTIKQVEKWMANNRIKYDITLKKSKLV